MGASGTVLKMRTDVVEGEIATETMPEPSAYGASFCANVLERGFCRISLAHGRIADVTALGPERPGEIFCSPGFIETQINGIAGVSFSAPDLTAKSASSVLAPLRSTGVTCFCPTLITSPFETLCRNFRVLEETRRANPEFAAAVPCYHLEGPYLSPGGARGAHDPQLMRKPDWAEFETLQESAGGRIGILTIAPELPGALELIRRASGSGVVVSIGHTDGTARDIRAAVEAGARMSTHLGNGCPELMHRHDAPLWAQLVSDELYAGFICDGFHLPTELVQTIVRMKGPDRCVLVTDAIHITGMAPGFYELGTTPIELLATGKVVALRTPPSLAGSSLTMDTGIQRCQALGRVSMRAAVRAATANPARLLGPKYNLCDAVASGAPAHFALWNAVEGKPCVQTVYVSGKEHRIAK